MNDTLNADDLASIVAEHTTGDAADTETVFASIDATMEAAYEKAQSSDGSDGSASSDGGDGDGAKAGGAQPRDPATGQFTAKQPDGEASKPADQAAADAGETGKDGEGDQKPGADRTTDTATALKPPPGWSADAKAKWDRLDPVLQAAIAKREEEVSNGFKEYGERVRRYEAIDAVIAPRRAVWERDWGGVDKALSKLVELSDFATHRPAEFIPWLAAQTGIDLAKLAGATTTSHQPGPGSEPAEADDVLHPKIATLEQKVNELLQRDERARTAAERAKWAEAQSKIDAFRADPTHPHFDAVRGIMSSLISSGVARDLDDAYEMAVRAHPEVYQKTVAELEAQRQREAAEAAERQRKEAAEKAARALKAQGTVIPRSGAPAAIKSGARTIEQTMEETWNRLQGAA